MLTSRRHVADFTLADIANAASVLDAAEALARIYDFAKHPYFIWANAPTTTLEEFRASQAPYLHCVEQFSRSLAVVLARTPSMKERLGTVFENVAEEHGNGRFDHSHRSTYEGYLRAIGVSNEVILAPCPPRFYVASQSLFDFCLANTVEMGAAATGMVEYTHMKIARLLAAMIHRRFWGDLDAQHHYRFHAEIDAEHALSLLVLCDSGWKESRSRERIAFAMAYSVQVWWAEFDALFPAEHIEPSKTDGIRQLLGAGAAKMATSELDLGRVACAFPVRVRGSGEAWQIGQATSVGDLGIAVEGIAAPQVDTEVDVLLEPSHLAPIEVSGRVRSKPKASGEFCIEFILDADRREKIGETVGLLVAAKASAKAEVNSDDSKATRRVNGAVKFTRMTCDHVGIRVTDVARARSFYELFGFRLDPEDTWQEHQALGLVNDAGFRINLIYNAVQRQAKANVLQDESEKWTGITHLALSIDDLDEVLQFLASRRIPVTEGPMELGSQRRICFIRDPDENVIEFTERWSQQSQPRNAAS